MNEDFKNAIENFVRCHLDVIMTSLSWHFSSIFAFFGQKLHFMPFFPLFVCFIPSNYILSYAKFNEDSENGTEKFLLYCHDVIMTSFVIDVFVIVSLFHIKCHFFNQKTSPVPLFHGFYYGSYRYFVFLMV